MVAMRWKEENCYWVDAASPPLLAENNQSGFSVQPEVLSGMISVESNATLFKGRRRSTTDASGDNASSPDRSKGYSQLGSMYDQMSGMEGYYRGRWSGFVRCCFFRSHCHRHRHLQCLAS